MARRTVRDVNAQDPAGAQVDLRRLFLLLATAYLGSVLGTISRVRAFDLSVLSPVYLVASVGMGIMQEPRVLVTWILTISLSILYLVSKKLPTWIALITAIGYGLLSYLVYDAWRTG